MKKWIAFFLSAAIALTVAGCGGTAEQPPAIEQSTVENEAPPADRSEEPSAAPTGEATAADGGQSLEPETPRILIAYFTWADNTVVEDPSTVDVDATTSASVLAPGNAAKIAGWIQQEVGGDLFSIVVSEPYSSDYDECLDRAADEKADQARPALVDHVSGMEDYDIVFLGFPNWWYTLPMAVLSFVEEYDFSGKTIIPFCTHGTGGLSNTIQDLTAALPDDVTILDPGPYRCLPPGGGFFLPGCSRVDRRAGLEYLMKEASEYAARCDHDDSRTG